MKINDIWLELGKIKNAYRELIVTSNYKQINDLEISWDKYTSGIQKNLYAREYEILCFLGCRHRLNFLSYNLENTKLFFSWMQCLRIASLRVRES